MKRRIAIVSDIHGDVEALRDALCQIDKLGVGAIWCAGDIVGTGGVFPGETIALIRQRGIVCVRGNHDRWAVGRGRADQPHADVDREPYDASGWSLSDDEVAWLAALPTFQRVSIDGVRVVMTHGTLASDIDSITEETLEAAVRRHLVEAGADVMAVGHTHRPLVRRVGRKLVCNPGALCRSLGASDAMLLDPVTGKWSRSEAPKGGTYGVLDLETLEFGVYNAADGSEVKLGNK